MQKTIVPKPLPQGSHIRVIAPSCSGKTIKPERIKAAENVLTGAGFGVSFGKNVFRMNQFQSSDRELRLDDLHEAFPTQRLMAFWLCAAGTTPTTS